MSLEIAQDAAAAPAVAPTESLPTVSVLLPNYNHAQFIGTALSALTAQTRPPFEIVVVDDASTDDSIAVIESFIDELPQLRLLRNPRNLGVNGTLNRALREAQGTHIVSSAADDWLEPEFIARLSEAVAAHPEGRICVSNYVQYYEAENRRVYHQGDSDLGPWYAADGPQYFSPDEFRRLLKRGFVWLPLNAALVDRAAFLAVGGYDDRLRWHADWFANYTLAFRYGFTVVPEPLSVFRMGSTSYSTTGMRNPRRQRQVCAAICEKLNEPEFADIREALRTHPVAFSACFRELMQVLAMRPREWPFLGSLARWWLNEVCHGRRPRILRDLTAKFGNLPYSNKIQA